MIDQGNNGFDKSSIVGIILMVIIALWLFNPSEQKSTSENVNPKEEISDVEASKQSLETVGRRALPLESATSLAVTFVVLENDKIKIKISSLGAQVTFAELKGYTDYTKKNPVRLIDSGTALFATRLPLTAGSNLDTENLLFERVQGQEGAVVFRYEEAQGKYLQYTYTLSEDYRLKLHISSRGFSLAKDQKAQFAISYRAIRHEKGQSIEDRYTEFDYRYGDDKTDYIMSGEEEERALSWIAYKQPFFSTVIRSDSEPFSSGKLSLKPLEGNRFSKVFESELELKSLGGLVDHEMTLYFLPNDYHILDEFSLTEVLPLGWGIFGWINRYAVIPLFDFLYNTGMNIGLVVLLMTLIIKLALSFVTYKNYVSSAKMRVIKPDIEALNKKMANADNMKKQQATMQLYQKAGVNPMAGCLPALLQMPILIAVFRFFPQAIQLRQVEFLWMTDLSSYDSIYDFGFQVPFYGDHISLITILLSISMFLYSKMTGVTTPQPTQPGMPNMKLIMYLMPVMMIFWFNDFASGLSLYYVIANVTTVIQIYIIKNYIIDEETIRSKIQKNRMKGGIPKNKVQRKMAEMMKKSQRGKA